MATNFSDVSDLPAHCSGDTLTETLIGRIVPPIFAAIVLIGVTGNALVVAVILKHRHTVNSTNILIFGLAMSDLLFLLTCVPFTAIDYALFTFPFPQWWCNVQNFLQHLTAYVTVWTLVLMSFDRFLAVVFPFESLTWRSAANTVKILLCLWCCVAIGVFFVAVDFTLISYEYCRQPRSSCIYKYVQDPEKHSIRIKLFYFAFNAFGYFLPLCVSCALYAKMLHRFWLTGRVRRGNKDNKEKMRTISLRLRRVSVDGEDPSKTVLTMSEARVQKQYRTKRRVTRMILGVIATFATCWLPLNVCFFLHGVTNGQISRTAGMSLLYIQILSQVLAYTNSCVNPILYAFLSENYRHGFITIFKQWCCCVARLWTVFGGQSNNADDDNWAVTERTNSHRMHCRVDEGVISRTRSNPSSHYQTTNSPTVHHISVQVAYSVESIRSTRRMFRRSDMPDLVPS